MNPESGSIMRCVRHPSQFFTGFCSSCLAERLSTVNGSAEKDRNGHQSEIVEVPAGSAVPDLESKAAAGRDGVRERRTLRYLFQLDDNDDGKEQFGITKPEGISTSYSAAVDVIVGAHVGKKEIDDHGEDLKERGAAPSWLGSVFSRKPSKKASGGCAAEQTESKTHSQRRLSCDGSSFHERSRVSWEAPRHSWDGSVMSKALACSFACLDERESACCRVKRSLREDVEPIPANNANLVNEKPSSPCRGRPSDDSSQLAVEVSSIIRKKSNRWSKVWDRSITSPFKEFGKRREHVLERSLSESWRHCHKDKNTESVESVSGNSTSFTTTNQSIIRSTNAVNGDVQNLRPEWQTKKSEFRIRRSRSVHYSSPGNLDNGLLRFYLTPMRSSRRSTSKGRTKSSRSFARGIFGL